MAPHSSMPAAHSQLAWPLPLHVWAHDRGSTRTALMGQLVASNPNGPARGL